MVESIMTVLMKRDGMTEEEARQEVEDAREELQEQLKQENVLMTSARTGLALSPTIWMSFYLKRCSDFVASSLTGNHEKEALCT